MSKIPLGMLKGDFLTLGLVIIFTCSYAKCSLDSADLILLFTLSNCKSSLRWYEQALLFWKLGAVHGIGHDRELTQLSVITTIQLSVNEQLREMMCVLFWLLVKYRLDLVKLFWEYVFYSYLCKNFTWTVSWILYDLKMLLIICWYNKVGKTWIILSRFVPVILYCFFNYVALVSLYCRRVSGIHLLFLLQFASQVSEKVEVYFNIL